MMDDILPLDEIDPLPVDPLADLHEAVLVELADYDYLPAVEGDVLILETTVQPSFVTTFLSAWGELPVGGMLVCSDYAHGTYDTLALHDAVDHLLNVALPLLGENWQGAILPDSAAIAIIRNEVG